MAQLRVLLDEVHVPDTENLSGGHGFYLVGGIAVGSADTVITKPVLTSPIYIGTGETKKFPGEERLVFDDDVQPTGSIHVAWAAFHAPAGMQFPDHADTAAQINQALSAAVTSIPAPEAPIAAAMLPKAVAAMRGILNAVNKDDQLGSLATDEPLEGMNPYRRIWRFTMSPPVPYEYEPPPDDHGTIMLSACQSIDRQQPGGLLSSLSLHSQNPATGLNCVPEAVSSH